MKITEALDRYLKHKADSTRTTVQQVWKEWLRSCKNPLRAKLQGATRHLAAMTCSDNTLRKKLRILTKLYAVFLDLRIVRENPFRQAAQFLAPRRRQLVRPTRRVYPRQVKELLTVKPPRKFREARDRAIMAALFGCGLRRSEIIKLDIGDVRIIPEPGSKTDEVIIYFRVRGTKTGVDRDQPIPEWAWEIISAYIAERNQQGARDNDPLFAVRHGADLSRMSASNLYKLFVKYAKEIGAEPGTAPHAARASACTELLESGVSREAVQHFLGHASPLMVAHYDKRRRDLPENPGRWLKY